MAFNYGFDGLDFLPSLTFPGHQSLGDVDHSPFEDALATPRQSNGWTLSELIAFDEVSSSQLLVEDQHYSLGGGFASNSFDPASDSCWGDIPSRQTTADGSSDASAGGQGARLAPQDFNFSAQEDLAFAYTSMQASSSSLVQSSSEGDATFATGEVTSEDPQRGPSFSSFDGDQTASQGASSFRYEGLRDTQAIASSSEVSTGCVSELAVPPTSSRSTSSSASHPQAVSPASGSTPATRSLWKAPNAVAGPSRLVPIASREATTRVATPAVTELRRSSRKRTAPAAGYAESAVLPPPAKKRKATKGSAPKVSPSTAAAVETSVEEHEPVAGPSRQATKTRAKPSAKKARSAKAPYKKGAESKRPRRTRAQVDMHKVAGMPTHACDVDGCALIWNPYKHEDNKEHLETHFDTADLEGDADLVCVFEVCKAPVPGKDLLQHMEVHHTGRPYLCPIRCGWQSCRSSYQKQHMDLMHEGVHWE